MKTTLETIVFFLYVTTIATLLNVAEGERLRRRANLNADVGQLQSLEDVRHAADAVLKKFHEEELDPNFGDGLPMEDVEKIRTGSEEFWNILKNVKNEDVDGLSDEEGVAAQNVIREDARLDEDLDNPQRRDSVLPEYHHLESELADVDW